MRSSTKGALIAIATILALAASYVLHVVVEIAEVVGDFLTETVLDALA